MAGSFDFISLTPGSVNKFGVSIDIDLEQCMSDVYSSMFRIWKQWRDDHDKGAVTGSRRQVQGSRCGSGIPAAPYLCHILQYAPCHP